MSKFKEFTDKELEEEMKNRATIAHIIEEMEHLDNQMKGLENRKRELSAHLERITREESIKA